MTELTLLLAINLFPPPFLLRMLCGQEGVLHGLYPCVHSTNCSAEVSSIRVAQPVPRDTPLLRLCQSPSSGFE